MSGEGALNQAGRASIAAAVLAAGMLYLAIAVAGVSALVALSVFGLVFFGLGLVGGHSGLAVVGIVATAFGAGFNLRGGADRAVASVGDVTAAIGGGELAAALGIGVLASAALLVTDASWWLRRDSSVDPEVVLGLAKLAVPAWLLSVVVGGAILWSTRDLASSTWLIPVAIVILSTAVVGASEVVRRRRPKRERLR